MYAFSGNWDYSVDEKGRLAVPAPLRRDMEGNEISTYMLTRGFEGTLWLFPMPAWQEFTQGLGQQLNMASGEARYLFRMFFSAATQCTPDKQGRITIPAALRAEIGLGEQAFVCGMGRFIEIWGKTGWDKYRSGQAKSLEDVGTEYLNMSLLNFTPLTNPPGGEGDGK